LLDCVFISKRPLGYWAGFLGCALNIGLGEVPTLATAPAIANAVAGATGARVTTLPLTAERVLAAIRGAQMWGRPLGRPGAKGPPAC
jgi:hypothetical protein